MPERIAPQAPTQAEFHAAIAASGERWFAACVSITRNRALAEDAVQEALLSAWSKRTQFQRTARLDTWIHRIAVNAALQALRKNRPASWVPLEVDVEDTQATPHEATEHAQLEQEVTAALDDLSDMERACFVLKHLEQWRLKEIAEQLEIGVGPVKQALFRALGKMRINLAQRRSEA